MLVVALLGAITVAQAEPARLELTPAFGLPVSTLNTYSGLGVGVFGAVSKAPLRNSPEFVIGFVGGYLRFPRSDDLLPSTGLALVGGTLRLNITSGAKQQTYVRLDGGLAGISYQIAGNKSSSETGLFASPAVGVQVDAGKRLDWVLEFKLLGVTGQETRELRAVMIATGLRW